MRNRIAIVAVCTLLAAVTTFPEALDGAQRRKSNRTKRSASAVQSVTVKLNSNGYQPNSLSLRRGIAARVTFVRQVEGACGTEIVLPEYNIRRELPLNSPVTIEFTPEKTGAFNFTCGMGMLRGKIVVQ